MTANTVASGKRVYNAFRGVENLVEMSKRQFADASQRKMKWVTGLYDRWREYRLQAQDCDRRICRSDLHLRNTLVKKDLAFSLACFTTEIRKLNGEQYPLRTVYQMIICLQMYLESNRVHWKLLNKNDPDFVDLFYVIDNLMKEKNRAGLGKVQSAAVISDDLEEKMWREGVLGEDQPKQLCDTVLYLLGVNLALRGGEEHKRLRRPGFNPQITVQKDVHGQKMLVYRADPVSKSNQSGIDSRKDDSKVVSVYPAENSARCPVRLYEKYTSLLPEGGKSPDLYLHPLNKTSKTQWYSDCCVGINTLRDIVRKLVNTIGITGKYTNHSLRATSATRMYSAGVPEKIIKEITGHKSDAVRIYERSTENVKRKASSTLTNIGSKENLVEHSCKKPKTSNPPIATDSKEACTVEMRRKKSIKIDVQKCIDSAGLGELLDNIPEDRIRSVNINIEIKYED